MKYGDRYVSTTRDRRKRPRDPKRWYRCRCGRWWGRNKCCMCTCGAYPRKSCASAEMQADADRQKIAILIKLGWKLRVSPTKGIERIGRLWE